MLLLTEGLLFGNLTQILPEQMTVKSTASSSSSAIRIRLFDGPFKLQHRGKFSRVQLTPLPRVFRDFELWAVVTTINKPSEAIRNVASLPDWCLLVVGDQKTPHDYLEKSILSESNILFLSVEEQRTIRHPFVQMVPFSSTARKNIGYLFAIRHGAKVIYEFEDTNVLSKGRIPMGSYFNMRSNSDQIFVRYEYPSTYHMINNQNHVFNPLPFMNPTQSIKIRPRGFPLVNSSEPVTNPFAYGSVPISSVAVIQSICNKDPDLDDTSRWKWHEDFYFDTSAAKASRLMIPPKKFTPYNSKATTHMYNAFWALLLPWTVTEPVSDIWRSYFAQRIFHDLGLVVLFEPPSVEQAWLPHDDFVGMRARDEMYRKTPMLLDFLHNWKNQDRYEDDGFLPAYIEKLWVALYEQNYIELDDVYAIQNWLLTLVEIGYTFPLLPQGKIVRVGTSETTYASPAPVMSQPDFDGQAYLASPVFNVGANGLRYPEFLKTRNILGTQEFFYEWLQGVKEDNRPSQETIFKLILMSKDEWPILKQWVLYHGELLGFQNLYILDGSSNQDSVTFLRNARDHLGVNVIFTQANLNELELKMTDIANQIAKSSDFIIKLDTDEFLAGYTGSPECRTDVKPAFVNSTDCTLSPYAWSDVMNNLRNFTNHGRMRIGWRQESKARLEVCRAGRGNDVGFLQFGAASHALQFKAISDSKSVTSIDLGGHYNQFENPFSKSNQLSNAGVIHVHNRCYEDEVRNARKACTSHGFFSEDDTQDIVLQKLLRAVGINNISQVCDYIRCHGQSCHKKIFYLRALGGCFGKDGAEFYDAIPGEVNLDFQTFLDDALLKYRML